MSHENFCDCKGAKAPDGSCPVLYEMRLVKTPEGREQLQNEYRAAVAKRVAERDGRTWVDVPYKLQKLGVPMESILALRRREPTSAMDAADRFLKSPRSLVLFLLLLGKPGTGKTTAAGRVVEDFCRRYDWNDNASGIDAEPVVWTAASKLTRQSMFDGGDRSWLRRLEGVHLLVIDDVGDEASDLGRATVADLCLARYANKRRTVITSNLTAEAFKQRYGEALADRIRTSGVIPNLVQQKSMRRAAV